MLAIRGGLGAPATRANIGDVYTVVNHLRFRDPVDDALFGRVEEDLAHQARAVQGFRRLDVVKVAADHVVLLITADDADAVERMATDVGTPWMLEHVVPLLAGPPDRHEGPIIAAVSI